MSNCPVCNEELSEETVYFEHYILEQYRRCPNHHYATDEVTGYTAYFVGTAEKPAIVDSHSRQRTPFEEVKLRAAILLEKIYWKHFGARPAPKVGFEPGDDHEDGLEL